MGVRKASKGVWRAFSNSIDELPRSSRLHRTLSRDLNIKLDFLVPPSSRWTQSEGEILKLLLTTHFPNSGVAQELADWRLATKVVTYGRVEWAIDYFAPYKSPGADGIFPSQLQRTGEIVTPHLVRIFHACLATAYFPAILRQVKVVFIPKPSRDFYSGPRDYRLISLTSFLLKTMERLVERYTGYPRRNVPAFGKDFLMLKCTDKTQNTYVQSWTGTEIMVREKCGFLAGPGNVPVSWQTYPCPSMSVVWYDGKSAHSSTKLHMYFLQSDN